MIEWMNGNATEFPSVDPADLEGELLEGKGEEFAHSSQIPTQDMRLGEGNRESIHHSQGKQWRQPHGR